MPVCIKIRINISYVNDGSHTYMMGLIYIYDGSHLYMMGLIYI